METRLQPSPGVVQTRNQNEMERAISQWKGKKKASPEVLCISEANAADSFLPTDDH